MNTHNWRNPVRPERLYKSTAFAAYRPAMRALGMLGRSRRLELTAVGKKMAAAFSHTKAGGACLSQISPYEKSLIKATLGLDYRTKRLSPAATLRRETYEVISRSPCNKQGALALLERFARVGKNAKGIPLWLHYAFIWELLSLGLALAFAMLLAKGRITPVAQQLHDALNGHPKAPPLMEFSGADPDAGRHVVALLRASSKLRKQTLRLDPIPFELERKPIRDRDPAGFLEGIVLRHRLAKPDSPWISLSGDRVEGTCSEKDVGSQCSTAHVSPRFIRADSPRP